MPAQSRLQAEYEYWHSTVLHALVARADNHRLKHVKSLFKGIGFDSAGADLRSRVFLGEAAWESTLFEDMTKAQRRKKAKAFFELLVN